jgi:hypothetical protein
MVALIHNISKNRALSTVFPVLIGCWVSTILLRQLVKKLKQKGGKDSFTKQYMSSNMALLWVMQHCLFLLGQRVNQSLGTYLISQPMNHGSRSRNGVRRTVSARQCGLNLELKIHLLPFRRRHSYKDGATACRLSQQLPRCN